LYCMKNAEKRRFIDVIYGLGYVMPMLDFDVCHRGMMYDYPTIKQAEYKEVSHVIKWTEAQVCQQSVIGVVSTFMMSSMVSMNGAGVGSKIISMGRVFDTHLRNSWPEAIQPKIVIEDKQKRRLCGVEFILQTDYVGRIDFKLQRNAHTIDLLYADIHKPTIIYIMVNVSAPEMLAKGVERLIVDFKSDGNKNPMMRLSVRKIELIMEGQEDIEEILDVEEDVFIYDRVLADRMKSVTKHRVLDERYVYRPPDNGLGENRREDSEESNSYEDDDECF